MARNDILIKKSFENKRLGGYISIDVVEETDNEDINENIEFKYNMVYDNMGKLLNGDEIWMQRLEEVKAYIDEHDERPTRRTNNKLHKWLQNQITNYNKKVMKNDTYDAWTKFISSENYRKHFLSKKEKWLIRFEEIKNYIDVNNKKPSSIDKIKHNRFLNKWLIHQQENHKNKARIMKERSICDIWTQFTTSETYKPYFSCNKERWKIRFEELKKYIDMNHKLPSYRGSARKLSSWVKTQQKQHKKNPNAMKENGTYDMWIQFTSSENYRTYFLNNIQTWLFKFEEVKKYIDIHNECPPDRGSNTLGQWINIQKYDYKKNSNKMKEKGTYDIWTQFTLSDNYKTHFISSMEHWLIKYEKTKNYIDANNKRPPRNDINKEISVLGEWSCTQQRNYKKKKCIMKEQNIYDIWTQFITSEKYKTHFIGDIEYWLIQFDKVKQYVDKYNKKPSRSDNDKEIKILCRWIETQQKNYKKKEQTMKEQNIYDTWTQFITSDKYKIYF
jgi:hypothetical protein